MYVHHSPLLTPNARTLIAVTLIGLLAVAIDVLAILDLTWSLHVVSNLFIWSLWVCVTPVAGVLVYVAVQRWLNTPH